MPTAEILYTDATLQIAAHANLLIVAWSEAPTPEQLRECGRLGRALAEKHKGGVGMIDLILSGTPRFSDATRSEAVKLTRDPTLFSRGIADAILVPGLVGVAVRAFLSTTRMMARSDVPTQVCRTVAEAAAWMAPRLLIGGEGPTAREIIEAVSPIATERRRRRAS